MRRCCGSASSALAASSWPRSMTSAARWNSRLRQAVRGYLDEQVRRIGRHLMAGQRGLRDVDGAVHHRETAELGDRGFPRAVRPAGRAVRLGVRRRRPDSLERCRPACPASTSRGAGVQQCRRAAQQPAQPFGAGAGLRTGGRVRAASESGPRQADGDGQVGVDRRDRRHRQRIEDAAVGQQPAVEHVRVR